MISNKDLRVEGGNLIINGEKHPLDPAVNALSKRANIVQGKFSALDTRLDAIEALEKTASGNPISLTGAAAAYAMSNIMTIEPIQDLHGYSKPWPGGGGKNLLPMTVDGIKAANTGLTWVGNECTYNGVTFTILTDSDGNVTGIKANGTATSRISLTVSQLVKGYGDTKVNVKMSEVQDSDSAFVAVWIQGGNAFTGRLVSLDTANDYSLNIDDRTENCYLGIGIEDGYTANNLILSPMIRLSTETDPTFAPYSNICPISGLTSGEVETTDGTDTNTATISFGQTVYGGSVNFKTGEVTVTHGMVDLGALAWVYNTNGGFSSDTLTDIKTGLCDLVCSGLSFYPQSFIWGDIANIPDYSIAKNAGNKDLYVKDTDYTTAAAFKTAMSGVQLCYELATPTTLTLTPAELELLKGANTVSGNGENISISYIGR